MSLLSAMYYMFFYVIDCILAIDLIYVEDYTNANDTQALPDFMLASMTGWSALHFSFTAFYNFVIIMKEMTMDQLAVSRNEDYKTGKVAFVNYNIDILYWMGIDGNRDDYLELAREFTRKYF